MVKPAGAYLDVIRSFRENCDLPVAAYQVSGEFAQLHAAAKLGWLDLTRTRHESLLAIKRAGGEVWAESEETAVIFGMPKEAIASGAVERVLRLEEIGPALRERLLRGAPGGAAAQQGLWKR